MPRHIWVTQKMQNKTKRVTGRLKQLLFLVFACFLGSFSVVRGAESVETVTKRLQSVQEEIRDLRTNASKTKGKAGDLEAQLATAEKEVGRINKILRDIERQSAELRAKLDTLGHRQAALRKSLYAEKRALVKQLRIAYAIGRQEKLKLLLNQQDPFSIGRTLVYYRYFNEHRTNKIVAVRNLVDKLDSLEQEINSRSDALQILGGTLQKQKLELESTREQRQTLLSALHQEIKQQDKSLAKLLSDEIELQKLLKSVQIVMADVSKDTRGYVPFSKSKGKLAWPLRGRLKDLFGKNRGTTAGNLKWQGVIIESEPGEEIRAIANGQVVFSDWMPSYGLLIIIDHGNGYMTLYGHNQSLYKSVGEWVESGELLAVVGDSGGQDAPGLYFEIRHKGKPLDPTVWCSSQTKMSKISYN